MWKGQIVVIRGTEYGSEVGQTTLTREGRLGVVIALAYGLGDQFPPVRPEGFLLFLRTAFFFPSPEIIGDSVMRSHRL